VYRDATESLQRTIDRLERELAELRRVRPLGRRTLVAVTGLFTVSMIVAGAACRAAMERADMYQARFELLRDGEDVRSEALSDRKRALDVRAAAFDAMQRDNDDMYRRLQLCQCRPYFCHAASADSPEFTMDPELIRAACRD
jgi:hypothetical protein